MDLNWCQYCERQLDDDYQTISSNDEDEQPVALTKTPSKSKKSTRTHSTRRNHPSLKSNKRSASSTSDLPALKSSPEAVTKKFKPWSGLYCSEECMQKDEQRSRLAIANLQASTSCHQIAHRASSNASSSSNNSHSVTSEDNPYLASSYSTRPSALSHDAIRRNSRSALALNLRRTSSTDRGSSDSLASQNSPRQYSPSFPGLSSRGQPRTMLRPMTPISTTFEEEEPRSVKRHEVNSKRGSYTVSSTLRPSPPEAMKPYLRHSRRSSASIATTKAGMMPAKSLAMPHLSQGLEGLALGTVFSPKSPGFDDPAFYAHPSPRHRSQASISSVPYSASSPTSSADSLMSSRSAQSSQSTAPSEVSKGDYFSHRRADSSACSGLSEATLQDYGLYQSRPHRTPSSPALPGLVQGKSPPRPPLSSSYTETSGGTISKIIQAKAQQRYASPDRRRTSVDLNGDLIPFPAVHREPSFSAANRNASFSSIKRTGSSASVTSLPHHLADSAPHLTNLTRNQSSVSVRNPGPLSPPYLTTVSSSAPKSWTWAGMPQYKVMGDKDGSSERKRLFYFDNSTPRVQ
jgi:hypothetical protein